jgi:hypothetical protein
MINRVKQFFSKETHNYTYSLPKDEVISKIISLFEANKKSLTFSDIKIDYLSDNSFSLAYNSGALLSRWYSSKLNGLVNAGNNNSKQTDVTTNIKISWVLYLKFFIFLILGLIYLIASLVTYNKTALLNASILIIAIPAFCV